MTTDLAQAQREWFQHNPGCESPVVIATYGQLYGDPALYCTTCASFAVIPGRLRPATEQVPENDAEPRGRYRLICVRCDQSIYLSSPRPRVPLCDNCRLKGATHD